jgi:Alw26I/Eco31I/Esp3I family type II restriction m6 adenine DNA methyltransferase
MNEQQAIALVQKTFKSAFDRSGYIHFLKNLLNEFDDEGARSNQGARIPDKFQNYVEKLERVGKYRVDDHEIMLFIVYLKNDTSLERARTMQRNFVAHYLQMDMKDAALVAFVSKDPANWRFSFIKMEYRYDEEKNKIKEEFTPAKRWSFLVGTNESSHTAQRKLVPLMADDEHNPTLAELEDAFNIEKVTKEFFEKYRGLFIRTKEALDEAVSANPKTRSDFESKGIDTVNLAKKLLGQIIFLYYLQKKGWFGVARDAAWGEGSRNFLRELFDKKHGDYQNFFNDILEPLFYDALRRDRSEDDHYYPKFNCKIPFLNGGLFDPMNNYDWVKTDILLPNELFHNTTKTKEGDEGDGILDIFDRYNFTVKEDEPFEKEVAIDPELLGKAYEKFNAIRPDNYDEFLQALKSGKKGDESKFNKQYGVYYTPREIVHYMCQQSLINYLYSELTSAGRVGDALSPYRDQAAETGRLDGVADFDTSGKSARTTQPAELPTKEDFATLILKGEQIKEHDERVTAEGRETATYSFQMPEAIRAHAALIDEKLANIKVCDPAVGSGAFPVGMMSEIVRARDVLRSWTKTKKTLYDFKRACIENSLYGVDIDPGAVEIAKLRLWLSLVVDEDDIQNIKPLPNLDYKIVCGNSLIGFPENWGSPIEKEIETLIHDHMNETNPKKKNELKNRIDEKIEFRYHNSLRAFGYQVNFDFRTVFSEVFRLKGGFDVVIGNPPYGLVNKRQNKGESIVVSEKDFKYFKNATEYSSAVSGMINIYRLFVIRSITILRTDGVFVEIFPLSFVADVSASNLRKHIFENNSIEFIEAFPERDHENRRVFETAKMSVCIMLAKKGNNKNRSFFVRIHRDKFVDLNNQKVYFDMQTLSLFDKENLTIPLMSQEEVDIILKVYRQSKKFSEIGHCFTGEVDLTLGKGYLDKNSKNAVLIKGAIIDKYLIRKEMSQGEIMFLDSKRYLSENKGEKSSHHQLVRIVMQGITGVNENVRLKMAMIQPNTFCGNSANYMIFENPSENLSYYLGLLNSTLLNFIFSKFSTNSNVNGYEVDNLPHPKNIDKTSKDQVAKLVERILAAKAKNPQADTSKLEEEIDQLVYQLYGLTEEEIKIVEGRS